MTTSGRLSFLLVPLSGAFLFAAPWVQAQVAGKPAHEEETVQLSPFVVTSDRDVGYLAGNTLAGSRLNTPLKDTPASLSILTEEFIKDIGAISLADAMEWANNVQFDREDGGAFGDNTSGGNAIFSQSSDGFRIRGQKATTARNYFAWDLPIDMYNVERIEETRGPNSILFGIGSPAGIISASTVQAKLGQSFVRGTATTDSNDSYRGTFDYNQGSNNGRLAVRVDGVYSNQKTYRLFTFDEQKRLNLAVKYQIDPKTSIRAEYETGHINNDRAFVSSLHDGPIAWNAAGRPTYDSPKANSTLRIALRNATPRITYVTDGNQAAGSIIDMASSAVLTNSSFMILDTNVVDPSVNVAGPGALSTTNFYTASAFLERQFGQKTFMEVAYNHQDMTFSGFQPQGDSAFLDGDPNNFLRNGQQNPNAGRYYVEGTATLWTKAIRSDDYRVTFSTELDYGKWGDYRLAALGEYQTQTFKSAPYTEVWAGAPFNPLPENAANQVYRRGYVTEGDWATYHIPLPGETGLIHGMVDPVSGKTLSSVYVPLNSAITDDPSNQATWLLGGQAHYFSDRLVVGFGFRQDTLNSYKRNSKRDPVTNLYTSDYTSGIATDLSGSTKTLGVAGHVTKNITLYYNQSDNLSLPPAGQRHTVDGAPLTSARGKGKDIGVGIDLFDGKVYARATYYETETKNANGIRFGGSDTNPNSVAKLILDPIHAAGKITSEEELAHTPAVGTSSYYDNEGSGYEISLTTNITKKWRLQANYSISDLSEDNIALDVGAWMQREIPYWKSLNSGNLITARNHTIDDQIGLLQDAYDTQKSVENRGTIGNRRYKLNLFTRYDIAGKSFLRGAYFGGGYRYQSKNLIGKDFDDNLQYGNSYWLADLMLGYQFHFRQIKNLSIQLNISNLFDADDPLITRVTPEVPVAHIKQESYQTPRSWRLTTNFAF